MLLSLVMFYFSLLVLSDIRPRHTSPSLLSLSLSRSLSLSLAVYGLPMRGERKRKKKKNFSAHSLRVPPAPTTIIYLMGPNPSSQIFTGCWFHSVTVTIWTPHGGLISCTRPIRKLTGSRAGAVMETSARSSLTRPSSADMEWCVYLIKMSHTHSPPHGVFSGERCLILTTLADCAVKWPWERAL